VVACYCATFLKPEMLHIYRQITALERVRPVVIAQKREHAQRFPFDAVSMVPKSRHALAAADLVSPAARRAVANFAK
jgi:hypothetical protein